MITRLKKYLGLHVHEWTKWEVMESGKVGFNREQVYGTYIVQIRYCTTCGKRQIERSSST